MRSRSYSPYTRNLLKGLVDGHRGWEFLFALCKRIWRIVPVKPLISTAVRRRGGKKNKYQGLIFHSSKTTISKFR
jgi:hypothetical protein